MNTTEHPDTTELDAYRAGRSPRQSERGQEIARHLQQCHQCSKSLEFGPALEQSQIDLEQRVQPWLPSQLAQRRAEAIAEPAGHGFRWLYATLPLLTSVFVVLFVWRSWLPAGTDAQTALPVQETVAAYASPREEMYANIDFYLWLDTQQEGSDDSRTLPNTPG